MSFKKNCEHKKQGSCAVDLSLFSQFLRYFYNLDHFTLISSLLKFAKNQIPTFVTVSLIG